MLDVFRECLNHYKNFRLLIIGDGPEKTNLQTQCVEKGIAPYVSLIGKQVDVVPYLRALDAFLLTSLNEQMPMTILEAMSLAIPVVASKVGEIPRIITHGKEGLVFALCEKPAIYAQALLALRDPATRQALGSAARRKIVAAFQEEAMVESYRQVIEGRTHCELV
jgi:glycosyltransferase involved in cell wall biosynthesis